ncbi:MAG: hypothetical protein GY820_38225 [Gammaproteobacteria bacterium]|nr:hypothetical protein [Gammaproteobacteria bacterium]
MMPLLSQWKVYLGIGMFAIFGFLYLMYTQAIKENEKLTVQYNSMVERSERDKYKIDLMATVAKHNEFVREEAEKEVQDNIAEIKALEIQITKQRLGNDKLTKMLAKHDLSTLITKKQSLMELRMRNATNRVFSDVEAATTRNQNNL